MTQLERPFLTARWTELLLVNFPVPADVIAQLAPRGTEPDLFDSQAYVSVVGFHFRDTRVLGCQIPGHVNFLEINLRFYVRRVVGDEVRRGVVFVQEVVPRCLIALVANRVYHESYVCRPMRSHLQMPNARLSPGDHVSYAWQSRRAHLGAHADATRRWNTLAARVAAPLARPSPNSLAEFMVEHYWGYSCRRDAKTCEYRVAHDPWRVALADDVTWNCDATATYDSPLAKYLTSPPAHALIADGAAVEVFPGEII